MVVVVKVEGGGAFISTKKDQLERRDYLILKCSIVILDKILSIEPYLFTAINQEV